MGRRGIRSLRARVGRECCISRGGRLNNGGIQVGGVRGESHSVTSRDAAEGAAPGVITAKSSEFGEKESREHLGCAHLEQVHH